jgi:ribose/xylose/arabinose/galactoside ABC-type transport system permease subunit
VLAFVKNTLGLIGMTPEQQDIVTGAVLVGTLVVFGASRNLRDLTAYFARRRED